ncbi:hypothetical protein NDU88_008776 [Pleurodeles waltl]|uniref:Uncharacterized protein n=1 Tax=Pleurodeles waltl TaxID=8319 RepID=A0AAV7QSW9_PLEWA|nr:hypothetical protein NDU88_008776 [Pleurodeles waltl]
MDGPNWGGKEASWPGPSALVMRLQAVCTSSLLPPEVRGRKSRNVESRGACNFLFRLPEPHLMRGVLKCSPIRPQPFRGCGMGGGDLGPASWDSRGREAVRRRGGILQAGASEAIWRSAPGPSYLRSCVPHLGPPLPGLNCGILDARDANPGPVPCHLTKSCTAHDTWFS